MQLEIVPFDFTPFHRRNVSPFINAGFYFSKLMKSKIRYQYADFFNVQDTANDFELDFTPETKDDMGVSIVAGLKFENFKLEFRNEFGKKALYKNPNTKNHSNTVNIRISL